MQNDECVNLLDCSIISQCMCVYIYIHIIYIKSSQCILQIYTIFICLLYFSKAEAEETKQFSLPPRRFKTSPCKTLLQEHRTSNTEEWEAWPL